MSNFWNKVAHTYDKSTNQRFGQANDKVIAYTKKYCKSTDRLLDIGCGTGLLTCKLAGAVKEIMAIDSSETMIEIAKEASKSQKIDQIQWKVADLSDFTIKKEQYSIITVFNVLLYVTDTKQLLEDIYEQLPEGGYFISVTDCMGEKKGLFYYLQRIMSKCGIIPKMQDFTMKKLEELVRAAGFTIEFCENVHTTPPNYYMVAKKVVVK